MLPSSWMETADGALLHKNSRNAGHQSRTNDSVEGVINDTL